MTRPATDVEQAQAEALRAVLARHLWDTPTGEPLVISALVGIAVRRMISAGYTHEQIREGLGSIIEYELTTPPESAS